MLTSALIKGLTAFATRLFIAMASEHVIEWAFFYMAEQIAATTKTPHDDKFVAEIKASFNSKKEIATDE